MIIDKVRFVKSLKERLKGIDFIEHRKHLEEMRRDLENYKKHVELEEYLEKADYA